MPRAYWDWDAMLRDNKAGFFPYTPSTNLLYGLREAIKMLMDEGLENVFARHERFGRATRAAVKAWGLEIVAQARHMRLDHAQARASERVSDEQQPHRVDT
jgi:alanine-glyoxylate transaminase/serine-glyoxylate transaminase/serine-pyruvate transaminase